MRKRIANNDTPRSTSLSRQVVNRLGERIVSGDIAVGDTLPNEDDLQKEFNVSRTVIREAVKILTDKGLLEVRPRRGTWVRPSEDWNLLDPDMLQWQYASGPTRDFLSKVSEVRRSIEVTASELAALRATQTDIDLIQRKYAALEESIGDSEAYIEADLSFHEAIFKACHNELLEQLALTLRIALQSSRKITTQVPGGVADSLPIHKKVVDAIVNRDPEEARTATNQLIDRSVADIEKILKNT